MPVALSEVVSPASDLVATALKGVDLTVITSEFVNVIPVVLPVALTFLGVRKGLSMFFGTLRGA